MRARPIFADGDEFHLRRDDAGAGVLQLGDSLTGLGAERATAVRGEAGKLNEAILLRLAGELGVFAREIAIVHRLHFATVNLLHVAALENPVAAQRGQTLLGSAGERGIAPRPGAIIDAHRRIWRDRAGVRLGVADFDLAHRHANVGMQRARDVNLLLAGSCSLLCGSKESLVAIINVWSYGSRQGWEGECRHSAAPFASITWSRFNGSPALRVGLSAFVADIGIRRLVGSPDVAKLGRRLGSVKRASGGVCDQGVIKSG